MVILALLRAMTSLSGCKEDNNHKDYSSSIWERKVNPPAALNDNAVITLSFDASGINAQINMDTLNFSRQWMFYLVDGEQFRMQNDTLYMLQDDGSICYDYGCAYSITPLSVDKIQLKYLGMIFDIPISTTQYLFNRVN